MTTYKEALIKARDALKELVEKFDSEQFTSICELDPAKDAIAATEEALAHPELCKYGQEPKLCTSSPMDCQCALDATFAQPEQEPVAWELGAEVYWRDSPELSDYVRKEGTPLYTTPPQRTWVGLTDDEMRLIDPDGFEDNLPQMIQQALKEKNT